MNVAKCYIRNISAINIAPTSEIRACDFVVIFVVVVVVVVVGRITDLLWPQGTQSSFRNL